MSEPTRAGYIAGLRALADVLEQHPEVPLPTDGSSAGSPILWNVWPSGGGDVRTRVATIVRALPCNISKSVMEGASASYMNFSGVLDGLYVEVSTYRDEVCERVVVGTEEVTKTVPDPSVEVPMVEVTETREVVEWRCGSLLADTTETTGATS